MKILHILPSLDGGGVSRDTLSLCHFLEKLPDTHVYMASAGGTLQQELKGTSITHWTLPLNTKNPWHLWRNAQTLKRLCRAHGIDLVHVHSRAPAWSCLWAWGHFRGTHTQSTLPWVSTFHARYEHKNIWQRLYASAMLGGAASLTASHFLQRHVATTYKNFFFFDANRLICVPRGIDATFFDLENARIAALPADLEERLKGTRVCLMPGRATASKGHAPLIQAFARCVQSIPDWRLVMTGLNKDTYKHTLQKQIQALGVQQKAVLLPYQRDMRPFYKRANIVAVPSLQPEGFGLVIAEAAAMEKPVLAFAHGGAVELVQHMHTGWLAPFAAPANHVPPLAEGLETLTRLSDKKRAEMGQTARQRVCKLFSSDVSHRRTHALYQTLFSAEQKQ